ncbi:HIRAN domain-containing protein [Pseudomonas helleri]|uniref:HIRAN domain-containing protein n=1 Tax=Pseudomonas helleri TaxID=1608996 RepID=UPI0030DDAA06
MSWWKHIFSLCSKGESTATHSATNSPSDDLDDDLLVETRNLIAITGPKMPYELARLLKISHARAAKLVAAANAQPLQALRNQRSEIQAQKRTATQPEPPAEHIAKKRAKNATPPDADLPPVTGKIAGEHECAFDVVGESHYQPALRKLRNGRHMATDNDFVADIVGEPDNPYDHNACAVYIEGSKVGYLPRDAAADFHKQVTNMNVTGPWRFQTKAKLYGGWGDRPMVGVLVGLPKSESGL